MSDDLEFVYGKRFGGKSIKVYKKNDNTYSVILKFYFAGICYKKKKLNFLKYGDVDDLIIEFKEQPDNIR